MESMFAIQLISLAKMLKISKTIVSQVLYIFVSVKKVYVLVVLLYHTKFLILVLLSLFDQTGKTYKWVIIWFDI